MAFLGRLLNLLVTVFISVSFVQLIAADVIDDLAADSLANVHKILNGSLSDGATHASCTKNNIAYRREFGNLTQTERAEYIKAVLCLQSKPSKISSSVAPGAKTRYDDFVAVHIQNTMSIHGTASFLTWHRYFTWAYERALRDECGYTGYQPYWNWGKYSEILKSPIFNGDEFSMSGNGEYVAHKGHAVGTANVVVPAGQGGGCVSTGPFKNWTVNLGPIATSIDVTLKANPDSNGLGYNPRCLRRDITDYFTKVDLATPAIQNLITQPKDIGTFQNKMQTDTTSGFGVHSAGHFTIWGDPGGDFYVSPGDPAFWLHHGMIDRTWWIWQNQDPAKRVQTVDGQTSMFGGAKGTLNDNIDLSVLASALKIKDLVSTTAGPFCYAYQ